MTQSTPMSSLAMLVVAILLEVAGTTCMKLSDGFSRLGPSLLIFLLYGASLACFTIALRGLPLSIASAVWSGVGTSLIAVIGFVYFREPVTAGKLAFLVLILVGVVGLNLQMLGEPNAPASSKAPSNIH